MQVYYSMSNSEFIAHLRDGAIAAKLPPLVIDAIDKLDDEIIDLRAQIETLQEQLNERDTD
mgnify:CR=1 FL=1